MSTAPRNFNRRQALEKEVKDLYAKITIGASGACTLTEGYGFASVTKMGTGDYKLVLQDKYVSLKSFKATLVYSSANDINFQVKDHDVTATAPYVEFFTLTGGSAANATSGAVILVKLEVKNTSVV